MKVTRNWLREYVAFDWSAEELAERLTMLGLEVERVDKTGGEFEGVVVAEVVTRDKHPNADKLSVCRVNDGTTERQIVCGANNFQAGDRVALILPGHALPLKPGEKEPFVIKVGKIRGVESHGMMCSGDELGIDPESIGLRKEDGILILRKDAVIGQPFAEYLGREGADVVYDLEVTPNRPDLNSVVGIAREIAAITGNPLTLPEWSIPPGQGAVTEFVKVRVEAPDLCPRYSARVIRGVRVGPSSAALRCALEKVGVRSVNNIVDVTNYVMLLTGQPLHAFDAKLIERENDRATIVVRRAQAGEKFVTLDGKEHTLGTENLLIADPKKGIALAGVMGGQNSEVSDSTTEVLLESAHFAPTNIRRTSKALGLRTDASYRFERGTDPEAVDWASRIATALIIREAGGTPAEGVVDVYPEPAAPRRISLRHEKVNALLGTSLAPGEIEFHLGQLGLKIVNRRPRPVDATSTPEPVTFQVPSYRGDLKREADLIEEVARLHGIDKIPSTPPRSARGSHAFDTRYDAQMEIRRILTGLGLDEAQGQTLISKTSIQGTPENEILNLANPLSRDMDVLRPSLLPGLLDVLGHNARHQILDIALFEVGRVFRARNGGFHESWRIGLALTGARSPGFWQGADRGARHDAYDLKGIIEELLERMGLRNVVFTRRPEGDGLFAESAVFSLGGRLELGEIGQVHPRIAHRLGIRNAVFLGEIDLDQLLARRGTSRGFKPLPVFPAIRRDVAMIVPESVTHDAVLQAVRGAKAPNLEAIQLFDVFRGQHVGAGEKSMAYAFTYRAADRTLTDAEVNAAHARVVEQLKRVLNAKIRE